MPARHDLLVGALDFPWRPWGSIEVWERPITVALREVGVTSMLIADHPHLFEIGGENYHCEFTAWEYQRGSESDRQGVLTNEWKFGNVARNKGAVKIATASTHARLRRLKR